MPLQVIGAGLGRTGTNSLKLALERLTGGRCYHMIEVFGRLDQDPQTWLDAFEGRPPDWEAFLGDFDAVVDWPACAFWRELGEAYPDALVLLSTRASADEWWKSASNTIFEGLSSGAVAPDPAFETWRRMATVMMDAFTPEWQQEDAAKAAYERHNAAVRAGVDPERLVEWQPGDGWEPLCRMLGVPVPDEPFPHVNTTEEFRANLLGRQ